MSSTCSSVSLLNKLSHCSNCSSHTAITFIALSVLNSPVFPIALTTASYCNRQRSVFSRSVSLRHHHDEVKHLIL